MTDLRQIVSNRPTASQRNNRQVVNGYVSFQKEAPSSFTDQIWVLPSNVSPDAPWGPFSFPAIHGSRLPIQGDPVVLVIDDNGTPWVAWWGTNEHEGPLGAAVLLPIRYHRIASYTFTAGAWSVLPLDTLDFDYSNGAYSLSGGEIVVPATGAYWFACNAFANVASTQSLNVGVIHNGTHTGDFGFATSSGYAQAEANATGVIACNAGDTLGLGYYMPVTGATMQTDGTPPNNFLTVMRVC